MNRAKQVWRAAGFLLVSLITLTHTAPTHSNQVDSSDIYGQVLAAGIDESRVAMLSTQRIPLAGAAAAAASVAPSGGHAAIVDSVRSELKIVDTIAREVLLTLPLRARPSAVALDESGRVAVVGYAEAPVLDVIGLEDASLSTTISLPKPAGRIRVSWLLRKVVATLPGKNAIAVYDLRNKSLSTVDAGRTPSAIDIDPATNSVLVANRDDDTVSLVSLFTKSVIATASVAGRPSDVAIDWTSGIAYIACAGNGRIARFGMTTREVLADLDSDDIPGVGRLALFPEYPQGHVRGLLVATSSEENSLTVFNLVKNTRWRIETGSGVTDVGAAPGSGLALVLSNGSDLLALDVRPLSPPVISLVERVPETSSDRSNLIIRGFNFSVGSSGESPAGIRGASKFAVMIGEEPAAQSFLVDDSTVKTISSGNLRQVPVRTVNANGYSNPVYLHDPSLTPRMRALVPMSGPPSGGISCTIKGENFLDGSPGTTSVWFAGNPAADVVVVDDNTIRCKAPAGTGKVDVAVRNDQGSHVEAGGFIYQTVGFSIDDVQVLEGDSGEVNAVFTVTLEPTSTFTEVIDYATQDGTANSCLDCGPIDYVSQSGTLTFAPGVSTQTITISIVGDTAIEPDEFFSVNLFQPIVGFAPGGKVFAPIADGQGTGTILNDDNRVSIADARVTEGDTGTTNMDFVVTVAPPAGSAGLTLSWSTADGTAQAGIDYTASSGRLSFAAGESSQTITVPVIGDVVTETDETFSVDLFSVSNGIIVKGQGVGTIVDNDPATLSVSDVSLTEGNAGATDAVFTLTLSTTRSAPISAFFGTADGTAAAGSDYTAASGSVTFAPGETTKTVAVPVIGDTLNEADEYFFLNITDTTGPVSIGDGQGEATILNDDALPSLSINDVTVTEGNSGTTNAAFTVTLSAASGQTVTVDFSTADGTANEFGDYSPLSSRLTFSPGQTTQTIIVAVFGDTFTEATETFFVNLSNPANALVSDAQGAGTIVNDDPPPALSIDDVSVVEGTGATVTALFTVTASNFSDQPVSVDFGTASGTATTGVDFLPTSGTLAFDFSSESLTRTVAVTIIGDRLDEADETFLVNLSNPVNATIADGLGVGTIVDDDPLPRLSINDLRVVEGNIGFTDAVFTVTLSAPSGRTVAVNYATSGGSSDTFAPANILGQEAPATPGNDFVPSSGTITFAPGETAKTITVSIIGDRVKELDEEFFVFLFFPTFPGNAEFLKSSGQCTIVNDDGVGPIISIEDTSVTEGNSGPTNATFNVVLSEPSAETVTADFNTLDGSALEGSDYSSASGTLTFNPGETAKTVTVAVIGDTVSEGNETFFAKLTNSSFAILGRSEARCLIIDDDGGPASLSINDVRVSEGNSGTTNAVFTVTLSAASSQMVTVNFATADGTATAPSDYGANSGTLTFPPGATTQTVTIAVNGDTLPEADEMFVVNLSNPGSATIARAQGTGTIINDDGVLSSLSINDVRITEGDAGTSNAVFTVTLSPANSQTVTVLFATANGTATAPPDYIASSGTLTFNPGTTTQSITVQVAGDTIQEPEENFFVNLSSAVNAVIADSQGVGTIVDNDGPSIQFSSANYFVIENGVATITVTRSGAGAGTVSVNFATSNGSALSGSDYVANSGVLSFAAGETSKTFQVSILDDALPENDETVNLALSSPAGGARIATPGSAVLTIFDNDTNRPGRFELSSSRLFVREGAANAVVTVIRSNGDAGSVSVDFASSDGSAKAGSDYTAASGTLTFAPGETNKTIVIPILQDSSPEDTEFFNVTLSNPAGGASLGQAIRGQVNILDDERRPPIVLGLTPICGHEGDFVLISGWNFEQGATVLVGNNAAQNVLVSGTTAISCNVPAGSGTVSLTITTSQGTATLPAAFTYLPGAKPPGTILSWFAPVIPEGEGAVSLDFLPPPRDLRATRTSPPASTGSPSPDASAAPDRIAAESPLELLSYNVYRSTDPSFSVTDPATALVANLPAGATTFFVPDTSLPGGGGTGSFFYRITAVYDQGESVPSNAASTDIAVTGVSLVTKDGRLTLVVEGVSFATFRSQVQVNGVTVAQTLYPTGTRLGNGTSAVIEAIDDFNTLIPVGQTARISVVNPGTRSDLSDAQVSQPFLFTRVP